MKHLPPDAFVIEAEPRTRQDIFDRVVAHYRAQPRQSRTDGRCAYRGPNGSKCFAGALIDDKHYFPEMEGYGAVALPVSFDMPAWFKRNVNFIVQLQSIHDTNTNWADGVMETVLEAFATLSGLKL